MGGLRFDGCVVLVTGGGQGLGRVYALEFAKRGASVVVNDLGSTPGGVGSSSKAADAVVEEIRKNGGVAVANYDSVEFGEKVVKTALDNFGRIDVVINNAGILRDRSFQRMSEQEWDIIHKVHLKGAFSVTKAAWNIMKEQQFGRVIIVSSPAGIYGNFGQTNYSAAKLGLVGFANTLSIEGRKNNILVNTIAPTALTRLTKDLIPEGADMEMKPDYIVPLVIYLCHESCKETGGLFELCAGYICKLRWQRTKGAILRELGKEMSAEDVRDNWNAIVNWDEPEIIQTIGESTRRAGEAIGQIMAGENDLASNHPIQPTLAKKQVFEPDFFEYDESKVILYALGVGVSTSQKDHLKFLYERDDNFCAIPSFGVIPTLPNERKILAPGLNINPTQVLHGEQYLELYKPIPVKAKLTNHAKVADVIDKGSGAAIIMNVESYDENGDKIFFNQFVIFVVGAGGFRGKRSSDELKSVMKPPSRLPDSSVEEVTTKDQAALYRLSGDYNPLHLDPAFAAMGGFKTPILHGLCSFGYATRHVMETYADNDPAKIKAIKVRFASPVLPGQTLRTDMWKEGSRIFFQTDVKETGKSCLTGAYIDLTEDVSNVVLRSNATISNFKLTNDMVRRLGAIFQWDITKDGRLVKSWEMNLTKGDGFIREGAAAHPGCTITLSDEDAAGLFGGTLNPQDAYNEGRLGVEGVKLLARKLKILFGPEARL